MNILVGQGPTLLKPESLLPLGEGQDEGSISQSLALTLSRKEGEPIPLLASPLKGEELFRRLNYYSLPFKGRVREGMGSEPC